MSPPILPADQDFAALITTDEASAMLRDRLPSHLRGIQQCVLLSAMDKAKMVEFIEGQIVSKGAAGATEFLNGVIGFASWLEEFAKLAAAIEARVICAAAHVCDMPSDTPIAEDAS